MDRLQLADVDHDAVVDVRPALEAVPAAPYPQRDVVLPRPREGVDHVLGLLGEDDHQRIVSEELVPAEARRRVVRRRSGRTMRPVSFAGGLFAPTDVVPGVVDLEEESVRQAARPVKAAAAPVAPVTFRRSRRLMSMAQGITGADRTIGFSGRLSRSSEGTARSGRRRNLLRLPSQRRCLRCVSQNQAA